MLTTRADLEALLGAVLWTQRTNPNLTGAMRARLTEIENRLMDGITHLECAGLTALFPAAARRGDSLLSAGRPAAPSQGGVEPPHSKVGG
jgi:hypothetical protein